MSVPATLWRKLRRDVAGQRWQFAAVTLTILLGIALFAASYDAYRNLDASYHQVFVDLAFADVFITGGDTEAIATAARATQGVAAVATRVRADVPFRLGADKLRGRVVGIPAGTQPAVNQVEIRSGSYPTAGTAVAEQHLAEHFDLAAGDTVEVGGPDGWREVPLTGSALSGEYLWPARSRQDVITLPENFGVVFATPALARSLAGHGPNQVVLRVADAADRTAVIDRVRQQAVARGATEVLTRADQPSNSVLREDVDGLSQMSIAFPLLFLAAAAMATYVLLARRVRTERDVIGMLLAFGTPRRAVLAHYLGFGVTAGALGAVAGLGLGLAGARVLTRYYVEFIDLPADRAEIVFRPETVAIGLAFGVVAGIVAALAPALMAARTPPAEAMRAVVPTTGGGHSLLERLVPPLRRMPARWRLVLRSIERNRRRTAYTVLGVMLSLLVILVSWTLIDTMNHLLSVQFDVVEQHDARVELAEPVADDQLAELAAVDGVSDVEAAAAVPVGLHANGDTYGTTLFGLAQGTDMHGFRLESGELTELPDDGLFVGQALQDRLGVDAGDEVEVTVARSEAARAVEIAGFVDEPLGTFAYLSRDRVEALFGGSAPRTTAFLRFEPGADREAIRRAVSALPSVAAYEDAESVRRVFEDFTGLFDAFVGGMLALGALMAFAIIFATMSVNILERAREVATLRAAGVHTRTIAWLIAAENLLVTGLGVAIGLPVGVAGGAAMLSTYSSDQFTLDLAVKPLTLIVSAVVILFVATLSQWPSLRAIRRMNIAAIVRERAS